MRMLLAKDNRYDADIRCRQVDEAKRILTEKNITRLMLSARCAGRDNSLVLIHWAHERRRLPRQITLVDPEPMLCRALGKMLTDRGYRGLDMRNYVKTD